MGLFEELLDRLTRIEKQQELILENQRKLEAKVDPKPEEYIDIQQAAEFLKLSIKTMYKKKLPKIKQGGKLMYRRSDLIQHLESLR